MKKILSILSFSLALVLLNGCVKEEYDNPSNINVNPNLTATHTIAQLQAMATGTAVLINTDMIISGIVTADDASGNFYKEIVIQDSTGGLVILVDQTNFSVVYPVGRRLFIKCKGLYVGNDNGSVELGMLNNGAVGRIYSTLLDQYIFKGQWGLSVSPKVVTINSLGANVSNMLVKIEGVEVDDADTAKTWANAAGQQSVAIAINDCNNNTIDIYTSGFADFANVKVPSGKGSVIGIFRPYGGGDEIIIRNTADVKMDSVRCGGGGGGGGFTPGTIVPITDIRALYTGTTTSCPAATHIKGIVISDKANSNITTNNVVIQDASGGIVIRFTGANPYSIGDEIEVDVAGQELSTFSALLQVNNVSLSKAILTGSGTITPRVATINDVIANFNAWESTLIKITNTTLSGAGTTFNGTVNITDATGTLPMYTRSAATFSGTAFPTGTVAVTGYLAPFNTTKQLIIRNSTDVQ
ncbi:MAG: hypothetical protein RIQ89_1095 [Bacteroidota bacterium]|jgi:DNA/RNA endonuclease YhcR with UshA esterase domain